MAQRATQRAWPWLVLAACFVGVWGLASPAPGQELPPPAADFSWPPPQPPSLPETSDFLRPPAEGDSLLPPELLRSPEPEPLSLEEPLDHFAPDPLLRYASEAPLGYTGMSSVMPTAVQEDSHFVPVEDRWRIGFPAWDRYGEGHPIGDDYPFVEGALWDPYNQNVLKGDYPIIGQHTFFRLTAESLAITEFRQVPTPTTPFESTTDPFQEEFFGDPDQFFRTQNFILSLELFHGDAAFKQPDWRIKATPIFNYNYLDVEELAVVNPDVREGTTRFRTDFALEEWWAEAKLADLSPHYDTVSVRAGSQPFVSDFRGFIFADINRGVRLFGTRAANREQFNLIWFDQTEKETNSLLNTFDDRHQNTVIANWYRQDFIWPGYNTQFSFHYNHDQPSIEFDENDFLVRPDPVGVFAPHDVKSYYFGWTGFGHIHRFNVVHAYYTVFGRDSLNPLAGRPQDISAHMAALELSYDRDWVRFRGSAFYSSGDDDINDEDAEGFDAIFDNPNFAGGKFSYWQRQQVRLFGVNLVQRESLVPNLRSSKFQGQTNFVNPGLYLLNVGLDADITPKLKSINNVNFLWFEHRGVLEQFVFQDDIGSEIGTDVSAGLEYRPLLNNNIIIEGGVSALIPGDGFKDLYNPLAGKVNTLFAAFAEVILLY